MLGNKFVLKWKGFARVQGKVAPKWETRSMQGYVAPKLKETLQC
ncbi:hypothetical protein SAMN05877753_10661 [Bacillus oleivorans]|uniref:Uncharacterized protein n=1 Tax=Bacillus oleivorans TaxID=1448271 RepID=A0A285CXW0_9BACI|nr:hypothetical protein SAMN05877753_10661 [Bacillus oleivorans]